MANSRELYDSQSNDESAASSHDNPDSQITRASSQNTLDSQTNRARVGSELESIVIQATCGQCWAYPNRPCKIGGGPELHLARYSRANTKGVITSDELSLAGTYAGESGYVTWPPSQLPVDSQQKTVAQDH